MIKELDCVALTVDLPEHHLAVGDVGAVVHVFKDSGHYTVEFTTFDGETVAVAKVTPDQVRPLARNDVHHSRRIETIAH